MERLLHWAFLTLPSQNAPRTTDPSLNSLSTLGWSLWGTYQSPPLEWSSQIQAPMLCDLA